LTTEYQVLDVKNLPFDKFFILSYALFYWPFTNKEGTSMERLETGIHAGRLSPAEYEANFSDLHPRLDNHEALVAADRCYFCYDAPCMTACPTSIDIPLFIRQISTGNPTGSAKTIFDQNILGGMCARVCPTEELCEQACVRNTAEEKPVEIGRLQRYATDTAMDAGKQFYTRAASTGKTIAVVGAGPAGLAAAHRLAVKGHSVVIYDGRAKSGGLNEYGIATYKTVDDFAQKEVDYVLSIGGIEVRHGEQLGRDYSLADLQSQYDAVFLGIGLAGVNALRVDGETLAGVDDAVDFIAALRQATDKSEIAIGRRIVVLGGGMTAIDAAVQAKLLGAEEVTICYRRGKENIRLGIRAGSGGLQGRHHPPLAGAEVNPLARRKTGRDRSRIYEDSRRPPGYDRRNRRHCRRSDLQGDRSDFRSLGPRSPAHGSGPRRHRQRRPHLAGWHMGGRRLRLRGQ
jgi:ferredoxin